MGLAFRVQGVRGLGVGVWVQGLGFSRVFSKTTALRPHGRGPARGFHKYHVENEGVPV